VTVDALCGRWRAALDAAGEALRAGSESLPAVEVARRRKALGAERDATLGLLRDLARERGADARFLHLAPRTDSRRVLGLPSSVDACVFNLDGVLIPSAALHAAAWQATFDEFIWARTERTGGRFPPFSPGRDYAAHLHARPRLEGVRAFLASRGIRLPEGSPDDPPGAETVHGLANRKNEVLRRRLDADGVRAYAGSLHYLQTAAEGGIRRAVVSASANTPAILERSGLSTLIEERVDGTTMVQRNLRPKPAPDTLLAACELLGVEPERCAAFETSPAGVAAARAAGLAFVIGVDQFGQAAALRSAGADQVVPGLAELLAQRLAA
jgi:beta-phosphoglucomutase-like phosphatase (HAD superfamily)